VFWNPLSTRLEDHFQVLVVNAQPSKALPARKTESKAGEGMAELLQHGLLRPRFLPPARASEAAGPPSPPFDAD